MFHATLLMIPTCFIHIICHYYAFSETNLLTRCHSASFCLLCLFIAEKAQKPKCSEKSRKITEILFHRKTHGARRASQGEAQGLLPIGRRGLEGGHPTLWGGPLGTLPTPTLRLFKPSWPKTSGPLHETPENIQGRRHIAKLQFGGQKSLFRHPAGAGNCPRSHLHRHLHRHRCLHDEEGVIHPRGWGLRCSYVVHLSLYVI